MDELCTRYRCELAALEFSWPELAPADQVQRVATIIGCAIGAFILIHPFLNGNGRMSRLLWRVLLYRMGLPDGVSVIRRPGPPYDAVMGEAMNGNFGPAVLMVLNAIAGAPSRALPTNP
jgi:hypothetical protein